MANLKHSFDFKNRSMKHAQLEINPSLGECAHGVLSCQIPFGNKHKLLSKYSDGVIVWLYVVEEPDGFQATAIEGKCAGHNDYNEVVKRFNDSIRIINPNFKLMPSEPVIRTTDGLIANVDPEFRKLVFPE